MTWEIRCSQLFTKTRFGVLVVKLIKLFSFTFRIGNKHVIYLEKIVLSSMREERAKYL